MRVKLFTCLVVFFFFCFGRGYCANQPLPLYTCEFYGHEETSASLPVGSIVTAYDPHGVLVGRAVVATAGCYGFLSAYADNPATAADEGAVDGDIITFYVNGVKQQAQAVYKSGKIIKLNLGIASQDSVYYNLHLLGMPGYVSFDNDLKYSGAAVADMITNYLSPTNTENQADLMIAGDINKDGLLSAAEMAGLLNSRIHKTYNFGTTIQVENYANRGFIAPFRASNQDEVLRQVCHWMAYKVPGAIAGKEQVPTAVATSSDPAVSADSDLSHWMLVVGVKTNHDPFPELGGATSFAEEYHTSQTLQLAGIYLNDPTQNGLGFHTYVVADVFRNSYFRPIAQGFEDVGKYVAVMEPPDPNAQAVETVLAASDDKLKIILGEPKLGVSVFIPGSVDSDTKNYLVGIFLRLKDSSDFKTLIGDLYFGPAIKDATVNRCYKVATAGFDYTIVPFDKANEDGVMITTAIMTVNNQTGQFQMAGADNKATDIFRPLSLVNAYKTLRKNIGWKKGEYPIGFWLSSRQGSQLYPGWDSILASYKRQGTVDVVTTNRYNVTADKEFLTQSALAGITVVSNQICRTRDNKRIRVVLLNIEGLANYKVELDKTAAGQDVYWSIGQDQLVVVIKGKSLIGCAISLIDKIDDQPQLMARIYFN